MSFDETKQFLMLMNAFYPNWKPEVPLEYIAKAWHIDLQRFSADQINHAFEIYRAQGNQFPPAQPGVLISLLVEDEVEELTEMQAWGLVAEAVKNGNYGAEKEFERLPADVQAALGSPGQLRAWAGMNSSEVHSVGQSNFLRAYRSVIARKKEDMKRLPGVSNDKLMSGM